MLITTESLSSPLCSADFYSEYFKCQLTIVTIFSSLRSSLLSLLCLHLSVSVSVFVSLSLTHRVLFIIKYFLKKLLL